ncbi:MAG: hypothetical protein KJO50_02980 [Bacteroidia bacterium]|nr:hypothetical protein [Bacteroidia bacterium]NNK89059.1 hypothetical protein [Saprospiraceae bacterium]
MKRTYLHVIMALFCLSLLMTSCGKDDPIIPNEEELITTLNYTLTSNNGNTLTLSFKDLDGDGGDEPVVTGGSLERNQSYTGMLEILNESESPAENITEEIEEEDVDHQFFFQTDITGLTVSYNDQDSNGNPVGLNTILTTGETGAGSLTIILKHEPVKEASGVSEGNITNAGGETDISVTFPINVQ